MVDAVENEFSNQKQTSNWEDNARWAKREIPTPSRPANDVLPAVITGRAEFTNPRVVGRPNMPNRQAFIDRIDHMYSSGWLSNYGPMVREFEGLVAEVGNAKHCIATCNGTVALELAIAALRMRGEVIVPSFTFVATVHALWRQGIQPVFCDVNPITHCLDPKSVEAAITENTTGILGVTLWGNECNEGALRKIADKHGLRLLLDSAHSFGCDLGRSGGRGHSDAEVFSFHATKCIHAIEGGAIVTDDDELAQKLRLMVNFGFEKEDTVIYLGTNGKMNEASASMGISSLEMMDSVFKHNRNNYRRYANELQNEPGITVQDRPSDQRHNYQYLVAEIDSSEAGISRDELVGALRFENIIARRYFYPGCHRMEPYKSMSPWAGVSLPITETISDRVFLLPNGLAVKPEDTTRIAQRISAIIRHAKEVRIAMAGKSDQRLPPAVPLTPKQ